MYPQSRRPQTSTSPSNKSFDPSYVGGTKYFQHYPSNFLKPYGLASEAPNHHTLLKRLNPISCEWLKRPKIAMSEFASTLNENMDFLSTQDTKYGNKKECQNLKRTMRPLLKAVKNLNIKNTEANPNPSNIDGFLEAMYEDDSPTHQAMQEMFQLGGAMYLMATQYLAVRELVRSPKEYASKMVGRDAGVAKFKREQNVPALLKMLKDNCTPGQTTCQNPETSGSLMAELKAAQQTKKTSRKRKHTHASPPESPSSSDSSESAAATPHPPKKGNRKHPSPQISSMDETGDSTASGPEEQTHELPQDDTPVEVSPPKNKKGEGKNKKRKDKKRPTAVVVQEPTEEEIQELPDAALEVSSPKKKKGGKKKRYER